jgi:hypothetical protein
MSIPGYFARRKPHKTSIMLIRRAPVYAYGVYDARKYIMYREEFNARIRCGVKRKINEPSNAYADIRTLLKPKQLVRVRVHLCARVRSRIVHARGAYDGLIKCFLFFFSTYATAAALKFTNNNPPSLLGTEKTTVMASDYMRLTALLHSDHHYNI